MFHLERRPRNTVIIIIMFVSGAVWEPIYILGAELYIETMVHSPNRLSCTCSCVFCLFSFVVVFVFCFFLQLLSSLRCVGRQVVTSLMMDLCIYGCLVLLCLLEWLYFGC